MQSLILTTPENPQVIIDFFIKLMNEDEKNSTQHNALTAIEEFVANDDENFIKLMQLESKPEKIPFLQIAAQNGRLDIVQFMIHQAMKNDRSKNLLYHQLTQTDAHQRRLIHWISQINKEEVGLCLNAILKTYHQLGIIDQINAKESVYGATALMLAARQGAMTNIDILLKHGANADDKTNEGETTLDLIKYADPRVSIPTMKYFVTQTSYGKSAFIRKHGDIFQQIRAAQNENINIDKLLTTLITIDLDAALQHELAQLSALKILSKSILMAESPTEVDILLTCHAEIDFAKAINGYNMPINNDKNELTDDVLRNATKMSTQYKLSDNIAAIYAEASFLVLFQIPRAHQLAFLLFTQLLKEAPYLSLEGFKKINKAYLDEDNQFFLTRNILLAIAHINTLELGAVEPHGYIGYFFEKIHLANHAKVTKETHGLLRTFTKQIGKATNMDEIQTILNDRGKQEKLNNLWREIMEEMSIQTNSFHYQAWPSAGKN